MKEKIRNRNCGRKIRKKIGKKGLGPGIVEEKNSKQKLWKKNKKENRKKGIGVEIVEEMEEKKIPNRISGRKREIKKWKMETRSGAKEKKDTICFLRKCHGL